VPFLIGVALACAACTMASLSGLDGDRAFDPTVLCVIATYYALFAAGGTQPGGYHCFRAGAFESEDQEGLKRAYASARTKAETLASLSGGVPGRTLSAVEDTNRAYPMPLGGLGRGGAPFIAGTQDGGVEEPTLSVSVTHELQ
jgi:uncharacterized protein YggE